MESKDKHPALRLLWFWELHNLLLQEISLQKGWIRLVKTSGNGSSATQGSTIWRKVLSPYFSHDRLEFFSVDIDVDDNDNRIHREWCGVVGTHYLIASTPPDANVSPHQPLTCHEIRKWKTEIFSPRRFNKIKWPFSPLPMIRLIAILFLANLWQLP